MDKLVKVNFMEKISEANVERIIKEELELEQKDESVRLLKKRTLEKLSMMLLLEKDGRVEERREIRNEVVVDNLRLVTQVLKKYGYFSADKFQNGCIGLLKAAETFRVDKEVPFHNYAAFCIETEIRMAFKRVNRAFEGKAKGFLDSLDGPSTLGNGDSIDKHDLTVDLMAEQEFDAILEEAETETLFYQVIIPCIEAYGTRAKDLDMALWRKLEIQYFMELSMEKSQRQRLTFTEMAKQLGTTPQNIRSRHKKVTELVRETLEDMGYSYVRSAKGGRMARNIDGGDDFTVKHRGKKHKNR